MQGALYVVATPIGNLKDWSQRAREIVANADLVLVEDTRVSRKLFEAYGLHPPVRVYEKYREQAAAADIVASIRAGATVALLSDAGTPGIADPGAWLVASALREGLAVRAIPGPSILATALSVSGVARLPIVFHGYLPEKTSERRSWLAALRGDPAAHVLLLPPHDAESMLVWLADVLPDRRMVLCRELTKVHEETVAGSAAHLLAYLRERYAFRGEMTLVIDAPTQEQARMELSELVHEARRLNQAYGLTGRDLSDFLAFKTGLPRRLAYRAVEQLKTEGAPRR